MIKPIDISFLVAEYLGIFILMFSTFLIGYFSSWWMQKLKYKRIINRLKKRLNNLLEKNSPISSKKNINDIDTIFTELKPKIIETIKETQEQQVVVKTPKTVAEKTRTSFITYTKSKPKLNFDNFGHANSNNSDDLTKLNGIGPYIEQKLNEIGIYNFDQISKLTFEDIRIIIELIDFFPGRIESDDWVGQATSLKVN